MAVGLYSGVSGLALGIGLYRNVSGLWGGASGLIDGFGGADPYAGASLYLNFLNPELDSRITFSRGTNATLIDSTGRLTYAPNNLLLRSQELENADWVKNGSGVGIAPVITPNAAVAPDGTTTADRVALANSGTTASDWSWLYQHLIPAAHTSYIFSVWLKAATPGDVGKTLVLSAISTPVVTLTADWQRVFAIANPLTTTTISFGVRIRGTEVPTTSATFFMWGAQVEAVTYQTTPSTYVATTTAQYYGPRFDYDPVTLAPRGLLIEEARTNLLTYSEQFDQGIWAKTNATISANATASPDGNTTADKLIDNATNATHNVTQSFSSTSGTSYTFTIYAKAAELIWMAVQFNSSIFADGLARTAYVNLSTGAVGTVSNAPTVSVANAGNGWRRVSITATASVATASGSAFVYLANADNGAAYAGTGTSGIYLYGAQLEAGSFATSYIPTVASTVTRSADVAIMTGTNFSSWYNQTAGTFAMNLTPIGMPVGANNTRFLEANDGTGNNRKPLLFATPAGAVYSQYTVASVTQANLVSVATGTFAPNINLRVATAYATDDFSASYNGATVVTDTSGSVSNTVTQLTIGYATSSPLEIFNGHIRQIAYYNTRLPNAQLQTLTAPSLATTLSLDFTSGSYNVGF